MSSHISVPSSYIDSITSDPNSLAEPVRDALLAVRRHRFLDGWFRLGVVDLQPNYDYVEFDKNAPSQEDLSLIYSNRAMITAHDGILPTSSTSQPSLVARMLQLLDVQPGMRILEIGTGTGYNAALLAELSGEHSHVVTVEWQQAVAEKARRFLQEEGYDDVHVIQGDGFQGVADEAPFDRIVATVGCSDVSPRWLEQLSPEGIMLIPLRHGLSDPLVRLSSPPNDPTSAVGEVADRSVFMQIQGTLEWSNPWQTCRIRWVPKNPEWCRPFPKKLEIPQTCKHPFNALNHWGFRFYLAFCSRELWYDNSGYGLADPGSKTIVKLTTKGIEGYSVDHSPELLEQLYERLITIHRTWVGLGCPSPPDFSLRFSPRNRLDTSSHNPMREWLIERHCFLETIRLQ